ncbi:hypothetical protein [Bradyrhizobium sp. BR 1432]|uniref:hypothetical protein n=1 Tax=Bradyrhizobium sp. BR 1432 TaxID=3447966 RepID=UPI003EE78E4E
MTAAIGLREDQEEYRTVRKGWIATVIDSLVAQVDVAIKAARDRNAFPGDLFHSMIILSDKLYCVRLDIMKGIAVDAASASTEDLNGARQEVNEIGELRLRHALQRLRDAGEAWVFATTP